jgi:hypothetical protein
MVLGVIEVSLDGTILYCVTADNSDNTVLISFDLTTNQPINAVIPGPGPGFWFADIAIC